MRPAPEAFGLRRGRLCAERQRRDQDPHHHRRLGAEGWRRQVSEHIAENPSPATGRVRNDPAGRWPATIAVPCLTRSNIPCRVSAVPPMPANAENRYEVTRSDLPLSCPMPGMALWNSHPKVYLPIVGDGGESVCLTAAHVTCCATDRSKHPRGTPTARFLLVFSDESQSRESCPALPHRPLC
jgi:uncharacterized Zn-finger protein